MKKCFLVFLALFLLISPCLAYSVPDDTVVYVTDTGTKYHRDGCSYLHSSHPMTIQQAEAAGYGPCSRCRPDRRAGEYESSWDGQSSSSSNHTDATERPTPTPTPEPMNKPDNEGATIAAYVALALFILFFALPLTASIFGALLTAVLDIRERIKLRRQRKREYEARKFKGPVLFDLIKDTDKEKDYWLVNEKGKKIYADDPEELSKKIEEETHSNQRL